MSGKTVRVDQLRPGDYFDATPLVDVLFERHAGDDDEAMKAFIDGAKVAADCLWFEAERVEHVDGGGYIVYGHPFNLPAQEDSVVELMEC